MAKPYFGDYYRKKAFSSKILEWEKKLDRSKYNYNRYYKYPTDESISKLYSSLGLSRYRTFTGFHAELMQWYPQLKKFTTAEAFKAFDKSIQTRYIHDLEEWKKANPSATGQQIDEFTSHLLNKYASEQSPLYKEVYETALQRWKVYQARERLMISGQYQYYRSENYREQYLSKLTELGVSERIITALRNVSIEKWYEYATTPNNNLNQSSLRLLPVLGTFYEVPEVISDRQAYLEEVTEKLMNFFNTMGISLDSPEAPTPDPVAIAPEATYARSKRAYRKKSPITFDKYFSYQRLIDSTTDKELKTILKSFPLSLRDKVQTNEQALKLVTSSNPSILQQVKYGLLQIKEKYGKLNIQTSYTGKSYVPFTANSKLLSQYLAWKSLRKPK